VSEHLVIHVIVDGLAVTSVAHVPAPVKSYRTGIQGKALRQASLAHRIAENHGIPPYEWPAVCGVVGVVYAGKSCKSDVCVDCAAQALSGNVAA
jgi:hypothetical protein